MPIRTRSFHSLSPWNQLIAVTAICPDGIVRKVRLAQSPDTYFTIRGRTRVAGLNVHGYVTTAGDIKKDPMTGNYVDNPDAGEYEFHITHDNPQYAAVMERIGSQICE